MSDGFRSHPLVQLTLLRLREFLREPEAVFWALIFPILLAGGLGIAFRGEAPEVVRVAVTDDAIAATLRQDPVLDVVAMTPDEAARALRSLADYLERHPEALIRGKPEEE